MKPTTMIAILALKLYIGHKRNDDRVSNIISIIEAKAEYQYGYNQHILYTERIKKPKNIIWSDEIAKIMES